MYMFLSFFYVSVYVIYDSCKIMISWTNITKKINIKNRKKQKYYSIDVQFVFLYVRYF